MFLRCALLVFLKLFLVFLFVHVKFVKGESLTHYTLLSGGRLEVCSSVALQRCSSNPFGDEAQSGAQFRITRANLEKFTRLNAYQRLPQSQKAHINAVLNQHMSNSDAMSWASFSGLFNQHYQAINLPDPAMENVNFDASVGFVASLDDPIYFALKDSFEIPSLDAQGNRKRVRVSMSHNLNKAQGKIFNSFVQRASNIADKKSTSQLRRAKPFIAVVTASVRDPFEEVDLFLDIFRSSGAEVVWLPLDPSFQVAQDLERKYHFGCDRLAQIQQQFNLYYREEIYPELVHIQRDFCRHPEKLHAILERVNGIFFNSGDQSFTLNALLTPQRQISPELAIIQRRHATGDLIVGGTGAGTVAMAGGDAFGRPIPMVSNGHSRHAMQRGAIGTPPPSIRCITANNCRPGLLPDDLTYRAAGGAGIFQLGLLDANFSDSDRETRLAVLTATVRQRLAFGIDNRTAMLLHKKSEETYIDVIGENGVFIMDFESGQATKRNKSVRRQPTPEAQLARSDRTFVEVAATAHYLSSGSEAIFNSVHENFQFSLAGSLAQREYELPALTEGQWRDFTRRHCGSKERIYWQQFDNHYQLVPDVKTQYYVSARRVSNQQISNKSVRQHCSYIHLPFVISYMSL